MSDTESCAQPPSRDGGRPPLDELLAGHLPELREHLRRRALDLLSARESASDLAQSVCREVIEHVDRFEHGGADGFRRWLFRTAERKLVSRYRYWCAEKRDVGREVGELLDGAGRASPRTPSRDAIAREELAAAQAALDRLPEAYRTAIVLSRVVGLPYPEIARRLERSEGAVRNLVHRGLAMIADELEAAGG